MGMTLAKVETALFPRGPLFPSWNRPEAGAANEKVIDFVDGLMKKKFMLGREEALREHGIEEGPYAFVSNAMLRACRHGISSYEQERFLKSRRDKALARLEKIIKLRKMNGTLNAGLKEISIFPHSPICPAPVFGHVDWLRDERLARAGNAQYRALKQLYEDADQWWQQIEDGARDHSKNAEQAYLAIQPGDARDIAVITSLYIDWKLLTGKEPAATIPGKRIAANFFEFYRITLEVLCVPNMTKEWGTWFERRLEIAKALAATSPYIEKLIVSKFPEEVASYLRLSKATKSKENIE